jgi:hypothetical protein
MSDGVLITRVDRWLGTRRDHEIKRLLAEAGILAFEVDVGSYRWTVEVDLDRSASAKVIEVDSRGETKVSEVPIEAITFSGCPVSLPRSKGDLSIPERITFLLPREQSLPDGEGPYSLRVEVHFLNREPLK